MDKALDSQDRELHGVSWRDKTKTAPPTLPPFSPRSNYRCLDIPSAESFLKKFAKKKHLETVF